MLKNTVFYCRGNDEQELTRDAMVPISTFRKKSTGISI
jgi:hypothetical protein